MENPTYQSYLKNPAVRERLEREVRRARAQAVRDWLVTPVLKMFRRPPPKPAPSLQLSV